jgi:predicted nuclease of predicted toxin-antitoxin system
MDFLANENLPLLSIRLLREAGHRVLSIMQETPGCQDEDVLTRACDEMLVILTFDRDYGELIYRHQNLTPTGVVYFRFGPATPSEPAEILMKIIDKGDLSLIGKFTVIEKGRVRQRALHSQRV